MKDALAAAAIFTGILLIIALMLYGMSNWHRWIDRRLRGTPRNQIKKTALFDNRGYPTISRADLDVEAAATEAKYYDLPEYRRHRNKFEGRHDAA